MKRSVQSIAYLLSMTGVILVAIISYVEGQRSNQKDLKRGDPVKIVDCFEATCWYKQCEKMTYLAGQALDSENAVWLLAEGCPWYQYPDIGMVTTKAVVTMRLRDVEKVK